MVEFSWSFNNPKQKWFGKNTCFLRCGTFHLRKATCLAQVSRQLHIILTQNAFFFLVFFLGLDWASARVAAEAWKLQIATSAHLGGVISGSVVGYAVLVRRFGAPGFVRRAVAWCAALGFQAQPAPVMRHSRQLYSQPFGGFLGSLGN